MHVVFKPIRVNKIELFWSLATSRKERMFLRLQAASFESNFAHQSAHNLRIDKVATIGNCECFCKNFQDCIENWFARVWKTSFASVSIPVLASCSCIESLIFLLEQGTIIHIVKIIKLSSLTYSILYFFAKVFLRKLFLLENIDAKIVIVNKVNTRWRPIRS